MSPALWQPPRANRREIQESTRFFKPQNYLNIFIPLYLTYIGETFYGFEMTRVFTHGSLHDVLGTT